MIRVTVMILKPRSRQGSERKDTERGMVGQGQVCCIRTDCCGREHKDQCAGEGLLETGSLGAAHGKHAVHISRLWVQP